MKDTDAEHKKVVALGLKLSRELGKVAAKFWKSSKYPVQQKGESLTIGCSAFIAGVARIILEDNDMRKKFVKVIAKDAIGAIDYAEQQTGELH